MILRLHAYWSARGCLILQPYDMEVGAGTFHPATTLRALGPKPWKAAYVQPSRRPSDGRYGENPNRLQHYYQYQVILKPSPPDPQAMLVESYRALGIEPSLHDIRFVEDDWESPTLGRLGPRLGGLVRRDGGDAVHLLPAGGRHRLRGAVLRADLRAGAPGDVHPGRRERLRPRLQRRGRALRRRVPPGGAGVQRPQFRARRRADAVPPLRGRGARVRRAAGARAWRCRPTTSASRRATASTCSTRAARSA